MSVDGDGSNPRDLGLNRRRRPAPWRGMVGGATWGVMFGALGLVVCGGMVLHQVAWPLPAGVERGSAPTIGTAVAAVVLAGSIVVAACAVAGAMIAYWTRRRL